MQEIAPAKTPPPGWLARSVMTIASLFSAPRRPGDAGAAGTMQAAPAFDSRLALEQIARNPYVGACVRAISMDLAALPLIVSKRSGGKAVFSSEHAALSLIAKPQPHMRGLRFRTQALADLVTSGNQWWLHPAETLLVRMHPARVRVLTGAYGMLTGWEWQPPGSVSIERFDPSQVLHTALISASDGADELLGVSPMKALWDDLQAERSAKRGAAAQSERSRPDFVLSPQENQPVGEDIVKRVKEALHIAGTEHRNAVVVGSAFKATAMTFSPRELEFRGLIDMSHDSIGVTFGVPASRLMKQEGGYGEARQQARIYWEHLIHLAAIVSDEWSRLTGDDAVTIEHDFSGVEALQMANESRLQQAKILVELGANPAKALEYVGMEDAPSGEAQLTAKGPGRRPGEPQEARPRARLVVAEESIARYLQGAAGRHEETQGPRGELEVGRLALVLEDAGVPARIADGVAGVEVELTDEAVRQRVDLARRDGVEQVGGLVHLGAFSAARASRIARRVTALLDREAA